MPWVTRYHRYDGQGNTRQLSDETGTVTDTFTYDAWGNEVTRTGTTKTPFRWNGRVGYYWDEETGTYQVRRRPYGPTIAVFLTVDPIWPADGVNEYAYVRNNTVLFVDPSGMQAAASAGCRSFRADMVAKSFINGLPRIGRIIPDRPPAGPVLFDPRVISPLHQTATDRLKQFATVVLWIAPGAFNQFPKTGAKDQTYRLYTRIDAIFKCCNGNLSISSITNDMEGGIEISIGIFPQIEGTINMSGPNVVKASTDTAIITWKGWGRPNLLAEPGMQQVAVRTSVNIWHSAEVWLSCDGNKGYFDVKAFDGSRFPSRRLWVNRGLKDHRDQAEFSTLWDAATTDPTFVRG